jgi:uncharacterized membrane protein YccF (DUF307 family)
MGSYKSGTGLWDPKWKHRWHIALLVLAVLVIILTGVYIGLAAIISRPDIMGIPFVSALTRLSPHSQYPFANKGAVHRLLKPSSSSATSSSLSTPGGSRNGRASRPT